MESNGKNGTALTPYAGGMVNVSDLNSVWKFAQFAAKSGMVPKDYIGKPQNIVVAIQTGIEIGLKPMQSLKSIAVINGRPCVWGDGAIAIVQASGKMEWIKESIKGEGSSRAAYCQTKRKDSPLVKTNEFSVEDAEKAGLLKKGGTWQTYTDRMLQMRARGFNLRDNFADVLGGLHIAEEVQDYQPIPGETQVDEPEIGMPQEVQGEESPEDTETISEDSRKAIFELIQAHQISQDNFKSYLKNNFKIESTAEIKVWDFQKVCEWIEAQGGQS